MIKYPMDHITINFFKNTEILVNNEEFQFKRKISLALLLIIVSDPEQATREYISTLLWKNFPNPKSTFRKAISELKKDLSQKLGDNWLISNNNSPIHINPTIKVTSDLIVFNKLIGTLDSTILDQNNQDIINTNELIPEFNEIQLGTVLLRGKTKENYTGWRTSFQNSINQKYQTIILKLIDYFTETNQKAEALYWCNLYLKADPFSQEITMKAMLLAKESGNAMFALQHFNRLEKNLQSKFNIAPNIDVQDLANLIQQTNQSVSKANSIIDANLSPFFGRLQEINMIEKYLSSQHIQLINIVGAGGMGKTRLARQAASFSSQFFKDGIYFINLDNLSYKPKSIDQIIRNELTISSGNAENPIYELGEFLIDKSILLILDKFDVIRDLFPQLIQLISIAPKLKIIITSQETFNSKQAYQIPLRGFKFPDPNELMYSSIKDICNRYAGIQFFINNIKRLNPEFNITRSNLQKICEICSIIEGNPLCIETITSELHIQSLDEILNNLQNHHILVFPDNNPSANFIYLQNLYKIAWENLSDEEKIASQKISHFEGTFHSDAAIKIFDIRNGTLEKLSKKLILIKLKNGIFKQPFGYKLYSAKLINQNSKDSESNQSQISSYYANFMIKRMAEIELGKFEIAVEKFKVEKLNIIKVWNRIIKEENGALCVLFATPLFHLHSRTSDIVKAHQDYSKAIEFLKAQSFPDIQIAKIQNIFAEILIRLNYLTQARILIRKNLTLFEKNNDFSLIFDAQKILTVLALFAQQFDAAKSLNKKSEQLAKKYFKHRLSEIQDLYGEISYEKGSYSKATGCFEKALRTKQKLAKNLTSPLLHWKGLKIKYLQGEVNFALDEINKAILIFEREQNFYLIGIYHLLRAEIRTDLGDFHKALIGLRIAKNIFTQSGEIKPYLFTEIAHVNLLILTGQIDEAEKKSKEVLSQSIENNIENSRQLSILYLARIAHRQNNFLKAISLSKEIIAEGNISSYYFSHAQNLLGICYTHLEKYDQAKYRFDIAIKEIRKNSFQISLSYFLLAYSDWLSGLGLFALAITCLKYILTFEHLTTNFVKQKASLKISELSANLNTYQLKAVEEKVNSTPIYQFLNSLESISSSETMVNLAVYDTNPITLEGYRSYFRNKINFTKVIAISSIEKINAILGSNAIDTLVLNICDNDLPINQSEFNINEYISAWGTNFPTLNIIIVSPSKISDLINSSKSERIITKLVNNDKNIFQKLEKNIIQPLKFKGKSLENRIISIEIHLSEEIKEHILGQ